MALADCSAAVSLCSFSSVSRYSVLIWIFVYITVVFACHFYIIILTLSWTLTTAVWQAYGGKGKCVFRDNSRTWLVGQLRIAVRLVSFYCRECSTFNLLWLFMGYCVILSFESYFFLLSRAKMTTAPYNYSYIFKYIIIGKWVASFPHVHCFIKRTIYNINVLL